LLAWQLIGPFEHASFDEAYDFSHPVEKGPVQLDQLYGDLKWKYYENYTLKIDIIRATGAAPSAGKIGAYYAVCWTNFGDPAGSASYSLRYINCGYKCWVNRRPVNGLPMIDSATAQTAGPFARSGWNEVLLKTVINPNPLYPSKGHAFSF
jgi:hypothetical protein